MPKMLIRRFSCSGFGTHLQLTLLACIFKEPRRSSHRCRGRGEFGSAQPSSQAGYESRYSRIAVPVGCAQYAIHDRRTMALSHSSIFKNLSRTVGLGEPASNEGKTISKSAGGFHDSAVDVLHWMSRRHTKTILIRGKFSPWDKLP